MHRKRFVESDLLHRKIKSTNMHKQSREDKVVES